jgi:methanogenic corrinoid protein MtbC1
MLPPAITILNKPRNLTMEYKKRLIQTLCVLSDARETTFMQIINLAMEGEMKDIHNAFEVGDHFVFELSHFENMGDTNLQKLVELCKHIESTYFDILNLNSIDQNEVNEHLSNNVNK